MGPSRTPLEDVPSPDAHHRRRAFRAPRSWSCTLERAPRMDPEDHQGVGLQIDSVRAGEPSEEEDRAEDLAMNLYDLSDLPSWEWPPDAGAELKAVLTDPDASEPDRLLAVELASTGLVLDDSLSQALLEIVQDSQEPQPLRCRSALALAPVLEEGEMDGFEDPELMDITEATFHRIKNSFRTLYHDVRVPPDVRRHVLAAAVRSPDSWHAGAVRAAFHHGEPSWRLTAVSCMQFIPGFEAEILEALESDDPVLLHQALVAAGDQEVAGAWSRIQELVAAAGADPPPFLDARTDIRKVLLAAIEAAVTVNPWETPDLLLPFTDGPDQEISAAATDAISAAEVYREVRELTDEDNGPVSR